MEEVEKRRKRGRLVLVLMTAMFILPLLIATLWFFNIDRFGAPRDTVANGELLDPPVSLDAYRGHWTVVQAAWGACGVTCRERLYDTRQVRAALHKDSDRVQRLLLLGSDDSPEFRGFIAVQHPDLSVERLDPGHPLAGHIDGAGPTELWLIDPGGRLMMRYPADVPAGGLLDDLKRLLRLSWIG